MLAADVFHYLHILVFAIIVGVELPALYAMRLARAPEADASARTLAVRVKRWSDATSALMLVLMLPLGVHIATNIGVYTLMSVSWLYATWIVGLVWLALTLAAQASGNGTAARRLYKSESVVRIIIGLGNVYDAIVGFMGTGMIQTNWLATKILLFGVILVISGVIRWQTQSVRFAEVDATGGYGDAEAHMKTLRQVQWGSHAILAMVLVAAFMGTVKPW